MTPAQCRMARAALRWSTSVLAETANVTTTTVNRYENGKDAYTSTASKLREALESSGEIRFESTNGVFVLKSESGDHYS